MTCLAEQIPLPSLVGFVGKAQDNTGKPVANSAALVARGKILFEQRKMLLPTYDVFDETRYFQPALTQSTFALGPETLGITICEDCWNDKNYWAQRLYARDPVAELAGKGSTVLLNISSSPYTVGKRALRFDMLRAIAREHGNCHSCTSIRWAETTAWCSERIERWPVSAGWNDWGTRRNPSKRIWCSLRYRKWRRRHFTAQIADETEAVYRAGARDTRDYVR